MRFQVKFETIKTLKTMKHLTFFSAIGIALITAALFCQGCKKIEPSPCPKTLLPVLAKNFEKRKLNEFCAGANGAPYEINNIVIEFADTVSQWRINDLRAALQPDDIDSCKCNDRLQNWKWDLNQTINIEEQVGTVVGKSRGEGDIGASPNYFSYIFNSAEPVLNIPDTQFNTPNTNLGQIAGTSEGTLIAILDTGLDDEYAISNQINLDSSAVAGCLPSNSFGWNFVSDNFNLADNHGHGTAVAGIIAESLGSASANDEYTCGARFLILKTLNINGVGNIFDGICAIDMAVEAGADVINISWGYYGVHVGMMKRVMTSTPGRKVGVIVTSMGNDTIAVDQQVRHYPSEYVDSLSNVFAVAGDERDQIWGSLEAIAASPFVLTDFSNYRSDQAMYTAPAKNISVWAPQSLGLPGNLRTGIGTSYSAAFISAGMAINRCCNDTRSPGDVLPLRTTAPLTVPYGGGGTVSLKIAVLEHNVLCKHGGS